MDSVSRPKAAADPRVVRVLIVDGDESHRRFLERVLRQRAYETAVAADGFEAIRIAETRGPFDLLVTEVVLQGIEGDELARRLRSIDPGLKILYLTEHSGRLFEERTSLWEEEAFLDKPVTVQGLLEAVSLILVGHIPAPRPVRVHVPGARVRLANHMADLVRLSVTGALIHAGEELPVGSTWQLVLEIPSETIRVTGRVVSCEPTGAVSPDGAAPPYAIAFAFVGPSAGARRALQRVVQQAYRG